jgi:hypothetical protein
MIHYAVNERFPHEQYLEHGEITAPIIRTTFFDVFVSFNDITEMERKVFRNGPLQVSLYVNSTVPFVVFDFGNNFSFDISINMQLSSDPVEWIESEGNALNMFLVDAKTGILKAMRALGIDMNLVNYLKQTCREQLELENGVIANRIPGIMSVMSTQDMKEHAIFKQSFK